MRIGSLFSGYGGLDLGVVEALGGSVAWHADIDPGANRILEHRYPDVPNHGDITSIDWAAVEPVDVLTGGFPCQDVSIAGRRAGIRPGTRSGLWAQFAFAIEELLPGLVVIENVRGLLSAGAHSDLEPCPWCVGDDSGIPLRALGAVLGDLADIGYDASWHGLRAADVGAPHGRFRVFIVARFADSDRPPGAGRLIEAGPEATRGRMRPGSVIDHRHPAAHPDRTGLEGRQPHPERRGQRTPGADRMVDWGPYGPAVRRWERLTRPAPAPTAPGRTGQEQLSPAFVEWMMGLPAGWVTEVPGLTRNQQLKALGNGVVPQQAAAALGMLLAETLTEETAA